MLGPGPGTGEEGRPPAGLPSFAVTGFSRECACATGRLGGGRERRGWGASAQGRPSFRVSVAGSVFRLLCDQTRRCRARRPPWWCLGVSGSVSDTCGRVRRCCRIPCNCPSRPSCPGSCPGSRDPRSGPGLPASHPASSDTRFFSPVHPPALRRVRHPSRGQCSLSAPSRRRIWAPVSRRKRGNKLQSPCPAVCPRRTRRPARPRAHALCLSLRRRPVPVPAARRGWVCPRRAGPWLPPSPWPGPSAPPGPCSLA